MAQPSRRPQPGPFPANHVIGLMLRLGLATYLLNTGLVAYLVQKNGAVAAGARGVWGNPYMLLGLMGNGNIPAVQEYVQFLGPLQVGLGVALALGFFTTWAATMAGFLTFLPTALQVVLIFSTAGSTAPDVLMSATMGSFSTAGNMSLLFLSAAVVWFAGSGYNPFSLDALIFKPGPARVVRPKDAEFIDPVPAAVPAGMLKTQFDPNIAFDASDPARA